MDQAMDAEAAAILRDEATAYDVLGVDRGAEGLGDSAIRYARNERWRRWQTDRCNHPRATEVMQRINGAYESVSDDARRANYDESMARAARRRHAPSGFGGATTFGGAAPAPSFGGGAFGGAAPAPSGFGGASTFWGAAPAPSLLIN